MFFATASRRHGLARWIPSLVRVGGVALAYYAAAAVSHSLALIHGNVSPLWIPSGIGLGALLVLGPRVWPGVGLGAFLANLATGAPPTFVLPVTLGNTGEALLAWRLLAPRPTGTATGFDLGALRRLLVAALTGALVSTVVGVAALRAAGMVGAGQGAVVGSVWWLGNVLGMLVIAPVLMAPWRGPAFLARRGWPVEAMLLLAGLVLIALVMVRRDVGYAYAVFPLLIWAAVRFEIIGATAAALLAALLAAWATGAGQSPFAVDTARGSLLPLQAYLTVVAGTALALAAALEERRLAEERLRQAGETQRALIDASPLAIVAVDERDRVLLWNPAAERLFGHRAAEVIGRPDPTVPPELAGEAEALRREALDRGADRLLETRRRRADGSLIDVQVSAAPFRDAAGVPIGTVAFLADLTEAKRAAEERERLVAMLEATPDFVGMADATGKALYINRAGRRMIGLPADAAVAGLTFRDFHPAWAADRVLAEGLPTAVRDGAWTGETALRTAEGREVPVSQALLAHHDADGRVVFFSTILRDLSDRIAAERALRESEERYRTLVNALPIAVVVQHGGKIAFCNPAAVQLLRAGGAEDLIGRPVLELVHPDDRESAPERADLLLGGGVAPAQAMRLVRLDGTEVHVEITSIPLPVGDDPGVLAMLRDVSERRRAEEALRRSEQRLRAILEAEPECVKLVGPDHTLHDMNQAGLSMIEADSLDAVRGCRLDQVFVVPEHRETFRAAVDRVLAGERGRLEFEIEGLKGTRRWLETHAVPYVDPVDGTRLVLAITRDITERKRTEQALRESEERQRLALTAAQLGTWRHDLASDEVRLDARAREHYDLDSEVVPFPEVLARVHPDDVRRLADAMARALDPAGRGPVEIEYRVVRRDGTVRWLSIHGQVEFESTSGRARAVRGIGTTQDITERKEAEAALRRSEERLRLALAGARAGVWDIQLQPRSIYWSEEYRALYGFSPDEPESDAKWAERIHPEDLPRLQENIRAMLQSTRSGWRQEFRIRHPARGERWILDLVRIRRDAAGRALSFGGINLDITDRKRVEQDLAARRAQLQLIADTAPVLIAHCDAARRYRFVNRAYAERFGLTPEQVVGRPIREVLGDAAYAAIRPYVDAVLAGERVEFELELPYAAIMPQVMHCSYAPERDTTGAVCGFVAAITNVTERKRAEEALRESEERFRVAAQSVSDIIYDWDVRSGHLEWLGDIDGRLGYPPGGFPRTIEAWEAAIHPEDRPRVTAELEEHFRTGVRFDTSYRMLRTDGSVVYWVDRGTVLRDAEGRPYRMIGAMSDVTAQREAEAALRRSEEQLRQAQKMEAVGRLAGGVAHDFNNLLTSMLGYADLVLAELPAGHPVRADVEEIQRAGQRAASLTRQLLAFSRRQVTRPRPVSLNTVVLDVERMLRRLLGEDVRLTLELAPRLGTVLADPAQLEQVIVNLAVNARDAMPEGGELSIATADVELTEETVRGYGFGPPGPYVTLTVRDTGVGMSEEVKARIFEPFFTTKELGRGTGLGLATVYGIVKQFGGYIWVESAPGQGSTFTVFFPRVRDTGSESAPEHPGTVPTGTERILLVEDEPAVRGMARRALEALGYRVVEAESGAEALARLAGAGAIDLLVTDVIMADVTGPELAMRIRQERPGLRVLFISGYPDTLRARQVELMPDAAYLQKPFTPDILGRAVRAVLDAAEPGTG